MRHQLIICCCVILILTACSKPMDNQSIETALLLSNEIQRRAHLQGNADLLAGELADSMVSQNDGNRSKESREAIRNRFTNYFAQVKYWSWDDARKPEIEIAPDHKSAKVHVYKFTDVQLIENHQLSAEHGYTIFDWQSDYKYEDGRWQIHAVNSSRKELSLDEVNELVIHNSEDHLVINEKELIPEGVAFDNKTGTLYLSSTYQQKIIAVHANGSVRDFKKEREEGLWSTVGMEVDEPNNKLWVISSNANEVLPMKYPEPESEWTSMLYEYDLSKGALVNKSQPQIVGKYFFNDLCVSPSGKIYVTESVQNKVYAFDPKDEVFSELAIADSLFTFPNGITASDAGSFIYIASSNGIVQYNTDTGKWAFLKKPFAYSDRDIDGLAYYQGTLIANQSQPSRVVQFELDELQGSIKTQRILEANNPDFDQATTGEITGNSFIFLANAQMRSGFANGKLKPLDSLKSVKILKVDLWPKVK